ncbi:MAG: DUF3991 and toprim domain-containing protein [Oscillospiraceae bacterium]|nr:DUF3991 and toprim domain-containing protein [Oscillospiraceae bacterium]
MRISYKRSPYIHFTESQKERANAVDLVDFLQRQGEELERSGREWRWKNNRGITIRGSEWYNQYEQRGGGPVQFVREFYNLSYPEAVTMLLNGERGEIKFTDKPKVNKERKPFVLPERSDNMRRVFAYLIKQRYIDSEIISHFAHERILYEDKEHHNAVFVGCDENSVPKHAHKRGTYSEGGYRGNVEGSDPRYCFRHIGGSILHVFEAPIDMLSYITMNKQSWKNHSYIALDGVTEHAMLWILEQSPHINKIRLCLDHDHAGIEASYRLTEILAERGYTDVEVIRPFNKDWNEDRKAQLGYDAEPPQENPKLEMFFELCSELCDVHGDILPKEASMESIGKQVEILTRLAKGGKYAYMTQSLVNIYAHSLMSVTGQMKRIGKPVTVEQLTEQMTQEYTPHKDKGGIRSRCDDIYGSFKKLYAQERTAGIRTTTERENEINNYVSLARECVKTLSFLRLEEQKQEQSVIQSMAIM